MTVSLSFTFQMALATMRLMLAVILLPFAAVQCQFPTTMKLERAFPTGEKMKLREVMSRDRVRHGRFLQSTNISDVVQYPLAGTMGLYCAKVQLGSPPQEFNVQIDTGSHVVWVNCNNCTGCATSTQLQFQLNFFDPGNSSTASKITCTDQKCSLGFQTGDSSCVGSDSPCNYTFQYADGSKASGYYIQDLLRLNLSSNSSAQMMFGCSSAVDGDLKKSDRAADGIFGMGPQNLSLISQLSSQGITPRVFSHCFKGSVVGGGTLAFGQLQQPNNLTYSPLVPSQPHYNLELQNITVNNKTLSIESSVFATTDSSGTIIDSGTTLAYISQQAYDPLIHAITSFASKSAQPVDSGDFDCFSVNSSVAKIFPNVTFNFSGGAMLNLTPYDYLIQQSSNGSAGVWCIGFLEIDGPIILGDLALRDKIFMYDLDTQRIGWTNFNCSNPIPINFTAIADATKKSATKINDKLKENAAAPYALPQKLILQSLLALLVNAFTIGSVMVL